MTRIGFLHTAQVHVPTFERLVRDTDGTASCVHAVRPDLLDQGRRNGTTADLERALLDAVEQLVADGADVVVCTCSTLGPAAEATAGGLAVPVLRVDRPMGRAAVGLGSRIGVVAALESTLEPTRALLEDEARRAGGSAALIEVCVPHAWAAFESGDGDGYLRMVGEAARSIADCVDVVVLAQASMMRATHTLSDLRVPVLASPLLAVQHALGGVPS